MTDARAFSYPRRLIRKYGTRDPFTIAEEEGVNLLFRNDFKRQKGAFMILERNSFIFINAKLSDEMQKLVCAHELGHALLHRELGKQDGGLLEFEIFDIRSQCEYDANVFSATLLLDDQEVLEASRDGYDIVQVAKMMDTNVNLLLLKMTEMNKQGYKFRVPYAPPRAFLGTIEDSVGEL